MKADVAIVVTTWFQPGEAGAHRVDAALRAVDSWWDEFDGASKAMVIADDGSDHEHLATTQDHWWEGHPIVRTPRFGNASALRAGARYVVEHDLADVIFYGADDWELTEPLDLRPSLELIRRGYADVVRLGPTHPNLGAEVVRTDVPGAEWCLRYRWGDGGYVVGWRPALYEAPLLADMLDGLDGLSAIEGERIWLERMAALQPVVMHAPNCTLAGPFRHLDTVELGEDDPATLTARYADA